MDLGRTQNKMRRLNYGRMGLNYETFLVIKLPDSRVLQIISRSLFLAVVILTLLCSRSIFTARNGSQFRSGSDLIAFDQLNLLLADFLDQGLLKTGQKALILNHGSQDPIQGLKHFNSIEFERAALSEFEQRGSFAENKYDFIFLRRSVDPKFVDLAVRINGIVAVPLSNNPSSSSPFPFPFRSNYRIVYLRKYSSMIMAMRKTNRAYQLDHHSSTSRRLCQTRLEAKKEALNGLEDVLLEPPRKSSGKLNKFSSKIKFLPDLMGDSLRDYQRRIFIGISMPEEKQAMLKWFDENYPKQSQEFEVFAIDAMTKTDVSDWLRKNNVKESEYVVMKAEAEVVEKMIQKRTIGLVDEVFLECRNQWWVEKKGKRAYWECLALYGKLRDEGIAVHQWWN